MSFPRRFPDVIVACEPAKGIGDAEQRQLSQEKEDQRIKSHFLLNERAAIGRLVAI